MSAAPLLVDLPEPILVLGAYGYRNIGDEAILAGLLRQFDPGVKLTVVSRSPAETKALHGVRSVGISSALTELRRHRSLLIGGGGEEKTLAIVARRADWWNFNSCTVEEYAHKLAVLKSHCARVGRDPAEIKLTYLRALGRLIAPFGLTAAAMGRSIAIVSVGVERDLPMTTIAALRLLGGRATSLTVRDRQSESVLQGWGIESAVTDDLSEAMPSGRRTDARAMLRAAGLETSRPIVGLCLTSVDQGTSRGLEEAVVELADAFPEAQFCFIPMSQHPFVPAHNDLLLGVRLRAASPRIAVLDGQHHPGEVLAIFSLLAAAVCMRYHSLLFAARAGIPIVAIPYAEKCRTWLDEHGIAPTAPRGPQLVSALGVALNGALAWSA